MLAWAWLIVIGGLMITPGGVSCPRCGPILTRVLGVVSIVLGVLGILSRVQSAAARSVALLRPHLDVRGDFKWPAKLAADRRFESCRARSLAKTHL